MQAGAAKEAKEDLQAEAAKETKEDTGVTCRPAQLVGMGGVGGYGGVGAHQQPSRGRQ